MKIFFVVAVGILTAVYIAIAGNLKKDAQYLVSYSLSVSNSQSLGNRVFVAPELSVNEINRMKLLLEGEQTNSIVVIISIYKLK